MSDSIKTNRLTIYMVKSQFNNLSEIVDERYFSLLDTVTNVIKDDPRVIRISDNMVFFTDPSHVRPPSWIQSFFLETLEDRIRLMVSSAKGLLMVQVGEKDKIWFAISFGMGRFLVKKEVIEERFGLKVVLNSVDPKSVRSIDKLNLGSVPKHSREQMSKEVEARDFGIDVEQDLISSVTGRPKVAYKQLGKTMTGRDALSVSTKVNIENIEEFLEFCYRRYLSDEYKQDFDWIDKISEVRNAPIERRLNDVLLNKINSKNYEKTWLAVPEVISWENVSGFRYLTSGKGDMHDDLDLATFHALLNDPIDLQRLRSANIYMIDAVSDTESQRWSVLNCLYSEIELDDKVYVLTAGKWYEIAKSFCDEILSSFSDLKESTLAFPDCSHKREDDYNKELANSLKDAHLLDKKNIMYGGGNNKIEFCDVITDDKKLIHVKNYSTSSVFSHFFAQGYISAEYFVADPGFRNVLNKTLPASCRLKNPATRPAVNEYEIVYGIISSSKKSLDIPFFSKVSLKNATRRLRSFGYKVSIKKIQRV